MKKGARTTLATLMALGIFGYFFWLGTPSGKGFMEHPLTQVVIDRILPFVLILSPLLAAVLTRTVPHEGPLGENQRARIRSLLTKLCLGTAASLAMTYWGVYISEMRPFLGFAILMQMSLLYILAVPLIRAKQLDASTKAMLTGAARTASLVPRNVSSPLPPQAWSIAWKLWGAGLFLVTVGLLWRRRWSPCEDAVFLLCLAGAVQAVAPFFLRWWLQQPEPMDEDAASELQEAYRRLRETKGWSVYAVAFLITALAVFFAAADTLHLGNTAETMAVMSLMVGPGAVIAFFMTRYRVQQAAVQRALDSATERRRAITSGSPPLKGGRGDVEI